MIGCLFILVGIVGLTYHATEFDPARPFDPSLIGVEAIRLLAVVFGIFLLLGRNWARWGIVAWLLFHTGVSAFHDPMEMLTHAVLTIVITVLLFLPNVNAYLRG